MTGKDLIIYILENDLLEEQVYDGSRLLGYTAAIEAAIHFDVGLATIYAWHELGLLNGIKIGGELFIPANQKRPNGGTDEQNS